MTLLLTDTLYDNYKRLCEIYNNYFLHLHAIQSIMSLYTSDWSYSSDHNIFSITVCTGCMRSLQSLAASFTMPTQQAKLPRINVDSRLRSRVETTLMDGCEVKLETT